MLSGKARITALDNDGKAFVDDVGKDDLWYFPTGNPHSIQGLPPDGCEFLLVFDDGKFSEADTTLISDWVRHTPAEVLAKNWGAAAGGALHLSVPVPGTFEENRRASAGPKGLSPLKFSFSLGAMQPTFKTSSGEVRVVHTRNFPVSTTIAAAHVVVKPGGLRRVALAPERR